MLVSARGTVKTNMWVAILSTQPYTKCSASTNGNDADSLSADQASGTSPFAAGSTVTNDVW